MNKTSSQIDQNFQPGKQWNKSSRVVLRPSLKPHPPPPHHTWLGLPEGARSHRALTAGQHPASCRALLCGRVQGGHTEGCLFTTGSEEMLITADRWAPAEGQEVTRPEVINNLSGAAGQRAVLDPCPSRGSGCGLITVLPVPTVAT